jgi:hypothetical protein
MRGVTLVRGCPRSVLGLATLAKEAQGQNAKSGDREAVAAGDGAFISGSDYTRFSPSANFL